LFGAPHKWYFSGFDGIYAVEVLNFAGEKLAGTKLSVILGLGTITTCQRGTLPEGGLLGGK
jgi:hypothetical protein